MKFFESIVLDFFDKSYVYGRVSIKKNEDDVFIKLGFELQIIYIVVQSGLFFMVIFLEF